MLRLLRLISYPQLRASWGRTALVVGGIATGVSLIVAINIINTSVLANLRHTIDLMAGPAALEVTLGVGEVGFDEAMVDTVRGDPDVIAAVPLVRGTISLADDPSETLQLFGADLTTEEQLQRYQVSTTNRQQVLRGLEDPRSILLTTVFASRHGVELGQTVSLSTPDGVADFTVRGLLEAEGLAAAFGGQLAVMDLPAAQLLLHKESRIDQIDVVLRTAADVSSVQQRLEAALPRTLSVMRPAQRGIQYESILGSFQVLLTGLSLLCLVAGVYVIYNTTSTGAIRRALVMASLRLIGAHAATLFQLLMLEALILGAVGTILGISSGIGLARLLIGMVADSMGVIFQLRFPVQTLAIDIWQLIVITILGIGAALFASYFAARRVGMLDALEVLRAELRSIGTRTTSRQLVACWVVLVVISAAALTSEVRLRSIAWGNFGSTLWNASIFVIAVPLVSYSAALLSRILPRFFGAEGRVAAESLFRTPTRTGVTVAAIALILTVAIMFASLSFSFRRSVASYFEGGFLGCDLAVSAVATEGGWLETAIPDSLVPKLLSIPGVRAAELLRVLPGQIYRGRRIALAGLSDGLFDPARYPPQWYRAGDPFRAAQALRDGDGALVSVSLADIFDLHLGDRVDLDAPSGPLSLAIVGIVPDYMSDRGGVAISRRLLVERWLDSSVNRINLFLDPGASLEAVRGSILEQLGRRYRLKILSLREVLTYQAEAIHRAFAVSDAIQLLIIIVTVAGIFDLLLASIVERRRELALWQVIGADERTVRRSVVIESVTIGSLGAVLGAAVGLVTAWIWVGIHFRYLLGYYLEYHFAFGATAWYVFLVVLMTMLAGYAAAHQATRHPVLDAMRIE